MTQTIDSQAAETRPGTDLVAELLRVLAASSEPLTVSKIRAKLPAPFRSATLEELTDTLQRQVAANVLFQYPKYRSQQDRFWDRPMEVHLANLIHDAFQEGPLGWAELRRKLPAYAIDPLARAEAVLADLLAQRKVYKHPRLGKRGGDRFGLQSPDAKEYLESGLADLFLDLEQRGFSQGQLRAAALELLHNEEWSPTASSRRSQPSAQEEAPSHTETTASQERDVAGPAQPSPVHKTARAQESVEAKEEHDPSSPTAQSEHEHAPSPSQSSPMGNSHL
jgi:hypothetical protein